MTKLYSSLFLGSYGLAYTSPSSRDLVPLVFKYILQVDPGNNPGQPLPTGMKTKKGISRLLAGGSWADVKIMRAPCPVSIEIGVKISGRRLPNAMKYREVIQFRDVRAATLGNWLAALEEVSGISWIRNAWRAQEVGYGKARVRYFGEAGVTIEEYSN